MNFIYSRFFYTFETMKSKFLILFIIVNTFACNSAKQQTNKSPLVIEKAFYQHWYGGQRGVKGIKIEINAKLISKDCTYKTIYYLDKKAEINTKQNGKLIVLKANINTSTRKDRMMSSDIGIEYTNQAPTKPKYPNLTKTEAIIEYIQNGELKYFKLDLVEKKALFYQ